jgi:uncharacterized linocin/CFP29 family protein
MSDFLMRDGAPFGDDTWEKIDDMVVTVMKKVLVGRRFIEIVGPLGWGVQVAPKFGFGSKGSVAVTDSVEYLPVEAIEQDFMLRAKDLAVMRSAPFALDLGAVAIAATSLAKAEDKLVFGQLLQAAEGTSIPLGDWDSLGGPFRAVAEATARLRGKGFDAPYSLVMSPMQYARLASLMQHGRREFDMVQQLAAGGVYAWPDMGDNQVLIVASGAWNVDLVLGQDAVTAYMGNEDLDHLFRVFETLVLRVKRPGAVALLQ